MDPCRLSLPFLANPRLRHTTHDPQAWARAIEATIPVRICEPLRSNKPFRNDTAVVPIGPVTLVTTHGSPISVSTDQSPCAQLLIPFRGDGLWTIENHHYANPAGESMLFTPPAPLRLENTVTSGVSINIHPDHLIDTALTMGGPEALAGNLQQLLGQPQRLVFDNPECRPLMECIHSTLITADQAAQISELSLEMLRLDDLLTRLVVLLLVPVLRQGQSSSGMPLPVRSRRGQRARIRQLTDWIEAHLDQPIALSDLERLSHFSRRTLQYAFRTELGCTPMQWVKARRLERAKARLLNPLPGESVSSIAAALGYVNASAFSRDFRRHHGCTAAALFRRPR